MITEEFTAPPGITRGQPAAAMGVSRKTANELCAGKRSVTVDAAPMPAKVFGNTAQFWLNSQQRNSLREALQSPKRMDRINRARPIGQQSDTCPEKQRIVETRAEERFRLEQLIKQVQEDQQQTEEEPLRLEARGG